MSAQFTPNPSIDSLAAYALADLSLPPGVEPVMLAQNEHVDAPCDAAIEAARAASLNANLYPDWCELRESIAGVHNINADRILCGAGSMELIGALGMAYLSPRDRVLVTEYGYLFTRTVAHMAGAGIDIATERDFHVDVDALLAAVGPETKILFLVNPGNPTGTAITNSEIRRLREALPEHVLLVIDEAYAEFIDSNNALSASGPLFDLIDRGDTIVLRTFSKVYGLAGMRVGWGYFPSDIARTLRKVLNPNSVSAPSQSAAAAAMRDQASMQSAREAITRRRDAFTDELRSLSLMVPESHSNFVLMRFNSSAAARSAFAALREQGILLRGMNGYGLSDCLRATIGTDHQMDKTLNVLRHWKLTSGDFDD